MTLWGFAEERFALPGVAEQAVLLQDRHQVDVLMLLWSAWLAERGCIADEGLMKLALEQTEALRRQLIVPLRAARRALKATDGGTLDGYVALMQRELAQERLQLGVLERLGDDTPQDGTVCASEQRIIANLCCYWRSLGRVSDPLPGSIKALGLALLA